MTWWTSIRCVKRIMHVLYWSEYAKLWIIINLSKIRGKIMHVAALWLSLGRFLLHLTMLCQHLKLYGVTGQSKCEREHNRPLWVAVQGLIRPTPYRYIHVEQCFATCFMLGLSTTLKMEATCPPRRSVGSQQDTWCIPEDRKSPSFRKFSSTKVCCD
jgi:hypothetical protein